MHVISTGEGWRKVKQSLLRLKSSLAKLQSFHQRQETDWHSCRRSCNCCGETTHACTASRDTRTVLLFCTGPQLCASGWIVPQPCSSRRCHFGEEPAWHFSQQCRLACFQDLLTVLEEEKCIKVLIMFPSLTSLDFAAGPVLGSSFAAAPHCPESLLNSPFQSGQLHDKEFLYFGGLTKPTRGTSGGYWGVFLMFFARQKRCSTVSLVCAQALTQSQSVIAPVKNDSVHVLYLAPSGLDSFYLLGGCKYLDLLQNRSVLLLFRRFLFLSSLGFLVLLGSFCQNQRFFQVRSPCKHNCVVGRTFLSLLSLF